MGKLLCRRRFNEDANEKNRTRGDDDPIIELLPKEKD